VAKQKTPDIYPHRATRRHRFRVWVERGILGVMMSVVAWFVERRLLKVLRSGTSSRKALEKDEVEEERRTRRPGSVQPEAGVAAGAKSETPKP
jgi:hypothetical protein